MPPLKADSLTDTIQRYYDAYRANDKGFYEAFLSNDFTFTSPYDDAIDKQEYFKRCWPNNARIKNHILEKISADGPDVFVQYLCETESGKSFRNVEIMTFEGERLKRVNVYFGAAYQDGVFQQG